MPLSELMVVSTAVLSVLALATWWVVRPSAGARETHGPTADDATLLFEDGVFSHASRAAIAHFGLEPGIDEWEDFQATVAQTFPQFPARPDSSSEGSVALRPEADAATPKALVSWQGSVARVVITDPLEASTDQGRQGSLSPELAAWRRMDAYLTDPVWQTNAAHEVIWHNQSYADLFKELNDCDPDPGKCLFDIDPGALEDGEDKRFRLSPGDDKTSRWYRITRNTTDDISVYTASCIDAVVCAEDAQRNFVQTLAKTFAHLSIGLAIFDRNQQLVLFNPALLDLTGLRADFLSSRPNVLSFFDGLRENRRMPEPKNYRTWRETISELFAAANDDRYLETWSLESGQTYRVTGRPHPDGATAFLIEDISAEVTLTRNFRAELELGQSLLDTLDDGLAVFSASGIQTFSNKTYCSMWQLSPEASFADVTINDAILAWKQGTRPNDRWQNLKDFVLSYGDREPWEMSAQLKDGRSVRCRLIPIVAGATLIRFSIASQPAHSEAVMAG